MSLYHFFMQHAGYSYNPATETPLRGRQRCAKALADAYEAAQQAGYSWEWSIDPYTSSAEGSDDQEPWAQWRCLMRDPQGYVVQALVGIDFGRDGDPYRRVVEAELACEEV